jgi:hybrid cluster-associated redox disulfide protein
VEGRIRPETNLNQLLTDYPALIPLFIKDRFACVGCMMAKFETLRDLSQNYNVDLEHLITEIEAIAGKQVLMGERRNKASDAK